MALIQTNNLVKTFQNGDKETRVLKGINFSADEGEFIAIMGRSGAGKSTFMYQISLLDEPSGGDITVFGKDTRAMTPEEKTGFRLNELGYVFQDYALLPDLTAIENVAVPLMMQGKSKADAYVYAKVSLERVGLGHRLTNLPSQMSGGEQQRTSIARALAHKPRVLFADEPTANLDNESSLSIMKLFQDVHKQGQTIIMVTHEEEYAKLATRIVRLNDGMIIEDIKGKHKTI